MSLVLSTCLGLWVWEHQVISLAVSRFLHTGNSSGVVEVIGQELLYRNIEQNAEAQTKNITKRRGHSVECGIRFLQYVLRGAVGEKKMAGSLISFMRDANAIPP